MYPGLQRVAFSRCGYDAERDGKRHDGDPREKLRLSATVWAGGGGRGIRTYTAKRDGRFLKTVFMSEFGAHRQLPPLPQSCRVHGRGASVDGHAGDDLAGEGGVLSQVGLSEENILSSIESHHAKMSLTKLNYNELFIPLLLRNHLQNDAKRPM